MSHFTVLVCLRPEDVITPEGESHNLDDVIGRVLEPWNENREVPERREYLEGDPASFWWVKHVRTLAGDLALTEQELLGRIRQENRFTAERLLKQPDRVAEVVAKRRAHAQRAAECDVRLGEHPTWADVAREYGEYYGDDTGVTRLYHDDETGRAYELTSYNPLSKWDWWSVGGRWSGRLLARDDADPRDLITGTPGVMGTRHSEGPLRCDGGPLRCLDLDGMRRDVEDEAAVTYDAWSAIVAEHGRPSTWQSLRGRIESGELTSEAARKLHWQHPAVQVALDSEVIGLFTDFGAFDVPRDEYLARARAGAVPGYALVTLGGEWVAPGEMGWFGMSSDEPGTVEAYHVEVNRYLASVPDDTVIVNVDCHI